ncbi:MAG: response regulator [Anaerolineae bacterium]|nr:response regulator [Anaerolineae bacterium]
MAQRILIVDDDDMFVQLLTLVLSRQGYECLEAYNGRQAIETIEVMQPDLMVLDDMMPWVNGPDVLRWICDNPATKDMPIIYMPGYVGGGDDIHILPDDFPVKVLSKPCEPSVFLAVVRELLPPEAE